MHYSNEGNGSLRPPAMFVMLENRMIFGEAHNLIIKADSPRSRRRVKRFVTH